MTVNRLKRKKIEKKIHIFGGLLVGVSCVLCFALCYYFHLNSMMDSYFHSTEQAASAARDSIYSSDAFIFSDRILSEDFMNLRREAEETDNYEILGQWLDDNGYMDFFTYSTERLQKTRELFEEDDVYVVACQGNGCYIILDSTNGFEYIGMKLTDAPELNNYESDERITPTISRTAEGWLCSAFLKIEDPAGKHHVFCGCDADMHVFVDSEIRFVINMFLFLLILIVICSIVGIYFARKTIAIPTTQLSVAARKFADENRRGEILKPSDPNVHTGDELEDINDSLVYLEESILDQKEQLEKINLERGRIETELSVARDIQMGMLPKRFDIDSDCDIFALTKPARLVGGDFYNCFRIDESHIALLIGDVSDKGIPAALFMMISQTLLQEHCLRGISPGRVLEKVNSLLMANNDATMFVTVWLGILDLETGILQAANGGHEYPLFRKRNGPFVSFHDPHSFVLAGMENSTYETYQRQLEPGDAVYLYTDGAHDACNQQKDPFGENALIQAVNQADASSAKSLVGGVLEVIEAYSAGAEQFDDITMLAMIYRGGEHL